jgi:hypothetical protein
MKFTIASRLKDSFSGFVLARRLWTMYTKWIGSMQSAIPEKQDGRSPMSECSKSAALGHPDIARDYVNPWLTRFGKKKSGQDGYVMLGVVPESGSRTELRACLLAVYDPLPQPGEMYVIHAQFIDITTGETFVEYTFIETLFLDHASGLIGFRKNTRNSKDEIVRFSFASWDSVNHHFIGSAT